MMGHFYQMICILLLCKLHLVSSETADCLEGEFEDEHGNCIPCKQCGPGFELSEDCGSRRESQCLPCRPGRYKEDRGHHHCLRCLNCAVINRSLKVNCSVTSNAICGDCLPGFYSKTRIGGFRELECFPCTSHTPRTESQCYPRPGTGQPTSTTAPPRDPVLLVAVIMVALSLILVTLVTFSVICCGRFLKSQFQRAFRRSQNFAGQPGRLNEVQTEPAHSPCGEQQVPPCCFGSTGISGKVQGPLEEVHIISKSITQNSCTVSTAVSLPPSVELCAIPPPPVKPHYSRSVSETQPLIRNSGCSDCFSGCGPSSEANQGVVEPGPTQTHSCASEKQHWSHAPVECTELDLENFSSEDASQTHSKMKSHHKEARLHTCSCTTPVASSTSTQDEACDDLASSLNGATLGLPISQIPDSLLVLLAHKMDIVTPGVKDFRDIGIALGVQPHLVEHMAGFKALHDHLSSNMSCTVQHLVQTLQRLQRKDALALICSHFRQ